MQTQRVENNVTPTSVDESGRSIENMAVKDLLKRENPISIKGTPPDTLMREFYIDKEIRLDAFNEKLLKVTFKIFQNLNKAAELLDYTSSREMLECQTRKEAPNQKKPTNTRTSSKAAIVTENKTGAERGNNPKKQGRGSGRGDKHKPKKVCQCGIWLPIATVDSL